MTRYAILGAALAVLCACAGAPVVQVPQGHRPLAELIQLTTTQGEEQIIPAAIMEPLGVGTAVSARMLTRTGAVPGGSVAHSLLVAFDARGGALRPLCLIWMDLTQTGNPILYDGWMFRTDLNGKLLGAAHGTGPEGVVDNKRVSTRTPEVRSLLAQEVSIMTQP